MVADGAAWASAAARPGTLIQRCLPLGRRFQLHLVRGAVNRAPVLVFGQRHAAFDADADTRLRWFAFPQQTLQKGHSASRAIRIDTLDGSERFPVDRGG